MTIKPMHSNVKFSSLVCALFLAAVPVIAQVPVPPSMTPIPPGTTLPTFPAPGGPGRPTTAQSTPDPNATPVPTSGNHESFSYAPSQQYDGVSVVYPTDGSGPYLVSESFLEASLRSTTTDDVRLKDFQMYEQMTNRAGEQFANQMYPDASAGNANVQRQVLQGNDRDVIVEQDPNAGPYARVTVTDKDGKVISELSVSAKIAAGIMDNPTTDIEKKIDALQNSKFALPEDIRANFNSLSKAELISQIAERPEFQNQEFVKMTRVFTQEKARKAAGGADESSAALAAVRTPAAESSRASAPSAGENPDSVEARNTQSGTETATTDSAQLDRDESTAAREAGWHIPTVIGILLGVVAVGIFVFGLIKSRRP